VRELRQSKSVCGPVWGNNGRVDDRAWAGLSGKTIGGFETATTKIIKDDTNEKHDPSLSCAGANDIADKAKMRGNRLMALVPC